MQSDGTRIGYATDLGRVPSQLIRQFVGVDILAIESNYDPEMQLRSGRPAFLQRRIMGGRGHLSNQQSFDAVQQLFNRCIATRNDLPRHVALLHRSRQCNCPNLVREVFSQDSRLPGRLTLAEQFTPTDWMTATPTNFFAEKQLELW
jgi:phosphoribosyl 1,2-cyclic phosphodiesterase